MIKVKEQMHLDFPVELVYETFRDNPVALADKVPQLERVEILGRECTSDGCMRILLRNYGRSPIPDVLRPVLNPSMLRWDSEQNWNDADRTSKYKIEAIHFRDRVDVSGIWTFCPDGNGGCDISVNGHVSINTKGIPGLPAYITRVAGGMVEAYISRHSRPNLLRMIKALEELLSEKYPEHKKTAALENEAKV